jgi:hypothetical protein
MDLIQQCPFCGKSTKVVVSQVALSMYRAGSSIQEAFPKKSTFDREVIKTGMCYDCQEKTFGVPAPEHEEAWGTCIGDCPCCGAPIYDKHNNVTVGEEFACKSCHQPMIYDGNKLTEVD